MDGDTKGILDNWLKNVKTNPEYKDYILEFVKRSGNAPKIFPITKSAIDMLVLRITEYTSKKVLPIYECLNLDTYQINFLVGIKIDNSVTDIEGHVWRLSVDKLLSDLGRSVVDQTSALLYKRSDPGADSKWKNKDTLDTKSLDVSPRRFPKIKDAQTYIDEITQKTLTFQEPSRNDIAKAAAEAARNAVDPPEIPKAFLFGGSDEREGRPATSEAEAVALEKEASEAADRLERARRGLEEFEDVQGLAARLNRWSHEEEGTHLLRWCRSRLAHQMYKRRATDPACAALLFAGEQPFPSFEDAFARRTEIRSYPVRGLRRAFSLTADQLSDLVLGAHDLPDVWLQEAAAPVSEAARAVRRAGSVAEEVLDATCHALRAGGTARGVIQDRVHEAEAALGTVRDRLERELDMLDAPVEEVAHRFRGLRPMSGPGVRVIRDARAPLLAERWMEDGSGLVVRHLLGLRWKDGDGRVRRLSAVPGRSAFTVDGGAEVACVRAVLSPTDVRFVNADGSTLRVPRGSIMLVRTGDHKVPASMVRCDPERGLALRQLRSCLVLSRAQLSGEEEDGGTVLSSVPSLLHAGEVVDTSGQWPIDLARGRTRWEGRPRGLARSFPRAEDDTRGVFEVFASLMRHAYTDPSEPSARLTLDRARFYQTFEPFVGDHLLEPVFLRPNERELCAR